MDNLSIFDLAEPSMDNELIDLPEDTDEGGGQELQAFLQSLPPGSSTQLPPIDLDIAAAQHPVSNPFLNDDFGLSIDDELSSHGCPPCDSCCPPSPPAAVTVVAPQRRRGSRRSAPQPAVTVPGDWREMDTKAFNRWRKPKNFSSSQLNDMRKERRRSRNREYQRKSRQKRRSGQGGN